MNIPDDVKERHDAEACNCFKDEGYCIEYKTKQDILGLMEQIKQDEINRCGEANAYTCWGILRTKLGGDVRTR